VAAFYQASWMQFWSLNQGMGHPDLVMYATQVINVGHKYRAGPSETAGAVAKRMGMSVQQLLLLNHDLRDAMAALPKDCEGNIYTKMVKVAFSLPMTLTGNEVTAEAEAEAAAEAAWTSRNQSSLLTSLMAHNLKVSPCKVSIQFLTASSRMMIVAGHVTAKDQVHPNFTCFTGTKVQILTLTRLAGRGRRDGESDGGVGRHRHRGHTHKQGQWFDSTQGRDFNPDLRSDDAALLLQTYLLTGTKEQILTREKILTRESELSSHGCLAHASAACVCIRVLHMLTCGEYGDVCSAQGERHDWTQGAGGFR
jgi:hypothetical protein